MLTYLAAVGLKEYNTNEKITQLINDIILSPTNKFISNFQKDKIKVEYYRKLNDKMGIVVRGEMTSKEELIIDSLLPAVEGEEMIDTTEADVEQWEDGLTYYAYCEEELTGTQIDFCLQNVIEYLEVEDKTDVYIKGAKIVGLSLEGKIILNVDKDQIEEELANEEEEWRKELIKNARLGDEEAQELLEIEAEEIEDLIEERMMEEDLLSIFEGLFIPYGDDEGVYSVLGTIKKVEKWENDLTNEKVYNLHLNSIGVNFEICINEKDLTGIPLEGMRFLGLCWIQGKLLFE